MTKTKEPAISTLSALKSRHLESLYKSGVTDRALELLSIISAEWAQDAGVAPAIFRRNHRKDAELIRWLENHQFITGEGKSTYEPHFKAFCAILVARKRVADSLFGEMKRVVSRALQMLDTNPLQTFVNFDDFAATFTVSSLTLPALKLLGSASLGIHLGANNDVQTVQFSEETLKGKKLLNYVSEYVKMFTRPSIASSPRQSATEQELNTFSINNLLLVDEAHKHAVRALAQHNSAPDTAISSAKSALEATLKYIAHKEDLPVSGAIKLPELFKVCKSACGLGSDASHKMGRSIASLCTEIAQARNSLGDSHGKAPDALTPTRSEARFIVGVALHLSECLLERYEAHRMILPAQPKQNS